jgi:hypothetical protein
MPPQKIINKWQDKKGEKNYETHRKVPGSI